MGPMRFITGAAYTAPFEPQKSWEITGNTIAQWNVETCLSDSALTDEAGNDNNGYSPVSIGLVDGP